jgi:hypothetical protein
MRPHGHEFEFVAFGGGWEAWGCKRCGRTAIPSIFGFLWPEVLGRFFERWRCH